MNTLQHLFKITDMETKELKFDYSKFDEFFEDIETPGEAIQELSELQVEYLELSLIAASHENNPENFIARTYCHDNAIGHSLLIGRLIDLLKSLQPMIKTRHETI